MSLYLVSQAQKTHILITGHGVLMIWNTNEYLSRTMPPPPQAFLPPRWASQAIRQGASTTWFLLQKKDRPHLKRVYVFSKPQQQCKTTLWVWLVSSIIFLALIIPQSRVCSPTGDLWHIAIPALSVSCDEPQTFKSDNEWDVCALYVLLCFLLALRGYDCICPLLLSFLAISETDAFVRVCIQNALPFTSLSPAARSLFAGFVLWIVSF